jgi:hypothetical protein
MGVDQQHWENKLKRNVFLNASNASGQTQNITGLKKL